MLLWIVPFACILPLAVFLLSSGCRSTSGTTAPAFAPKAVLSPFELSPPQALGAAEAGVDEEAGVGARDAKTQIQLQCWFVELPTADLARFGDIDEAAFKRLSAMPGVDLLSAPSIVTLPGMKGTIEIGREMFLTTNETDFAGVRLDVLPSLTPAGPQPITLQAQAVVSEQATGEELQAKGLAEEETAVAYRSVAKTLSLADGGFAEIGRIRKMHTTHVEDRIPLLGDIPLAGRAFRSSRVEHQARTIVILVKPTLKPVE